MNDPKPPQGGSRWRSCLGCTGCITVVAFFLTVGFFGFSIAISPGMNRLTPSPILEAGGVMLRAVLNLDPPSTKPPGASLSASDSKDFVSAEEAAYFNSYDWYRSWMLQSEERVRYLRIFSSFWSSRWKSQLAAEARSWRQLSIQADQIDPPAGDEAIHAQFLEGFKEYASAADDLDRFVQSGDASAYNESQAALKRGNALILQSEMVIAGGGSSLGPGGSDNTMMIGLLTEKDLPSGWAITSIPALSIDVGPAIPCGDFAMFDPNEITGTAGARFLKADGEFRTLQELIALVDPSTADDGMSYAKIGFPCDSWSDDQGTYQIKQLVTSKIGDDTVAYQYARHNTDSSGDNFADVILIRQGRLIIEVWLSGGDKHPTLDETVSIAQTALERAKSIPQNGQPPSDPGAPGNNIQVNIPRQPAGIGSHFD